MVAHAFNSALGRQRQMDLCEFKANLVYGASSRIGTKAIQRNPVSEKKINNIYIYIFIPPCQIFEALRNQIHSFMDAG